MAAAQSTGLPKQTVDLNKLKEELLAAKHSEDRYKRENDAKFRAIAQRVESYEEFRFVHKCHVSVYTYVTYVRSIECL